MGIIDTVKEHPYISAAVGIGAIVVVFIIAGMGGGDDTGATAYTPSPVETGNEMYAIDRQAQTQIALGSLQLEALQAQGATALSIKQLEAASYDKTKDLEAQIASQAISAQLTMSNTQSTLLAQLEGNKALYSRDIALANTNAALESERIRANENITTQNIMSGILREQFAVTSRSNELNYLATMRQQDMNAAQFNQLMVLQQHQLESQHSMAEQNIITQRYLASRR